tara:strand:- start:6429 stop:8627 length:2199 start_codon:yes stop_codon:yes gene_type:complete
MLKNIFANKINYIFLFLLISIFCFKNGGSNIFNGLPWINQYETIIFFVLFPFFFLINNKILSNYFCRIFIIGLFFFKLILFFAPQIGIGHDFYYKGEDNKIKLIRSYNNFWQKDFSNIQEFNWNQKKNFPLDWINFEIEFNNINSEDATTNANYKNLKLNSKIHFYLYVKNDLKFRIYSKGISKDYKILINKLNSNNVYSDFSFDENYLKNDNIFTKGIYEIKLDLKFIDSEWSFIPEVSYNEKDYYSALDQNLTLLKLMNYNKNSIGIYKFIAQIYEIIFFVFVGYLIINIFINTRNRFFVNSDIFVSIFFFLLCLFLSINIDQFLSIYGYEDTVGFWPITLVIIFFCFILLFDNSFKNIKLLNSLYENPYKFILLVIGPTLLYSGFLKFGNEIHNTSFWTAGDDFLSYQSFARSMVLDGQWLEAGEKVFYHRPAIRYVIAIFHVIFGKSSFVFKFADLWIVFLTSLITINLLIRYKVSKFFSIIGGMTILIFFLGENFRWLIGRGLSEFFGMFFILISAFFFVERKLESNKKIFLLSLLGIIAAWFREEKVLLALSLIFLSSSNYKVYNFWHFLYAFLINKLRYVIFYFTIVIIGFPILFELRNYLLGGEFEFIGHPRVLLINTDSFFQLVFATLWPDNLPRLTAIILFSSFLFSLISIFYSKFYRNYQYPGLIIVILSMCLPTILLPVYGYVPRNSIYLLPFATIYFYIIISPIYEKILPNFNLRKKSS